MASVGIILKCPLNVRKIIVAGVNNLYALVTAQTLRGRRSAMSKTSKYKLSLGGTKVSELSRWDELFQDISSDMELKAMRLRRRRWDRLQAME